MKAKTVVRSVVGVVVGAVVWMIGFYTLAALLAMLWPDFAQHGRRFMTDGVFTFTTAMAVCNLVFWVLAEIFAGWLAMKTARRREAIRVLAGLIGLYLAAMHIALYWPRFPWWYNLLVVIPAVPAVLFGAKLAANVEASVDSGVLV